MPPIVNNPNDNLKPDAPQAAEMKVHFWEVCQPESKRRAKAKGVAKPDLTIISNPNGKDRVVCPNCKGHRPPQCIAFTTSGWLCDGCVSDERRQGRGHLID